MYRNRSLIFLLAVLAVAPVASANTLFFHGDLRTNANVTGCGGTCTLAASDSDATWAQWAATVYSFSVPTPSVMTAITYSADGGQSLTGPTVAAGGFQPYLSLFDASGNFLNSTFFAPCCDVTLNGGLLPVGAYQIAISSWFNLSFAENLGVGTLADGFTGTGNLTGDLHYGFDVILPPVNSTVPEPASPILLVAGLVLIAIARRRAAIAN